MIGESVARCFCCCSCRRLPLLVQTPTAVWAQATDATLSALTVNDGTVDADLRPTFSSSVMSYRVAVKYRGDSITVAATPTDGNATVAFLDAADSPLGDADSGTTGYQVDVPVGESTFKVRGDRRGFQYHTGV